MLKYLSLLLVLGVIRCHCSSLPTDWIVVNPLKDSDTALSISFLRATWDGPSNSASLISSAFGAEANFNVGGVSAVGDELTLPFRTAYDKVPPVCTFELDGMVGEDLHYGTRLASKANELNVYAFTSAGALILWNETSTGFNAMCFGPRALIVGSNARHWKGKVRA